MKKEKNIVGLQNPYPRIRVSQKAYAKIAHCANETNKTMNEITSALLEFAIGHLKIKEELVPMTKLYIGDEEI